jgi:hypothetical protein
MSQKVICAILYGAKAKEEGAKSLLDSCCLV